MVSGGRLPASAASGYGDADDQRGDGRGDQASWLARTWKVAAQGTTAIPP
jgi:hypothetical protein